MPSELELLELRLPLALAPPTAAEDLPDLTFVAPLLVEAGPVVSSGRPVAPQTMVYASVAAGGGTWSVGLTEYTEVYERR